MARFFVLINTYTIVQAFYEQKIASPLHHEAATPKIFYYIQAASHDGALY